MNLHEECLLKYLSNPVDLMQTTEVLKYNNNLLKGSLRNNNLGNENLQPRGVSRRI